MPRFSFGVTFSYIAPLIASSRDAPLSMDELEEMPDYAVCGTLVGQYEGLVNEARARKAQQTPPAVSHEPIDVKVKDDDAPVDRIAEETKLVPLWSGIFTILRPAILFAIAAALFRIGAMFVQVYSLAAIIDIVGGTDDGRYGDHWAVQMLVGVALAAGAYGQSLSHHNIMHNGWISGLRARAFLCGRVYQKTLTQTPLLSSNDGDGEGGNTGAVSQGQQLNLVTSDANVVIEMMVMFVFMLSAPIEILGALIWLGLEIKWAAFATGVATLLFLPMQLSVGERVAKLRGQYFAFTDRRLAALGDYLNGISVVKFNAWEASVVEQVSGYRATEGCFIKKSTFLKLFNLNLFFVVPGLLAMVTFGVLNAYDTEMDPRTTFVAVALVQMIAKTFAIVPRGTIAFASARVAVNRVESFLLSDVTSHQPPELQDRPATDNDDTARMAGIGPANDPAAVVRVRGDFSWDAVSGKTASPGSPSEGGHPRGFSLRNLDIGVRPGQLLAVTGPVGCGKSTLLHAVLRNCVALPPSSPEHANAYSGVAVHGSVAYVAQEAWITDGTIRSNIIFGQPFDEERYKSVLAACCLHRDIVQWGGDMVEVGEKGVTLSGGQRQRVAMARACYADADVYLLDDPLSAVDGKVGRHLVERVLHSADMLRNKAVILATHNHAAASTADAVAVISADGSVSIRSSGSVEWMGDGNESTSSTPPSTPNSSRSGINSRAPSGDDAFAFQAHELLGSGRPLGDAEVALVGGVSGEVYKRYIRAGGIGTAVGFGIALVLAQACRSAGEWWFVAWSERSFDLSNTAFILVELAFVLGSALMGGIRADLYAKLSIAASTALHDRMFSSVLRAPLSFFTSTPLGRITNRFSKDLDFADDMLPRAAFDFMQLMAGVFGSLLLVTIGIPWFAIAVVVFGAIFVALLLYFLPAARQVKRVEGLSRSPSNQLFQGTLSGLATIRAFGRADDYREDFFRTIDLTTRAIITYDSTQRWIGARMDWISVAWVLAVGILCVAVQDSLSRGVAGLALSQALMLTSVLQYGVRMAAEAESLMTSVERIDEYGHLEPEDPEGAAAVVTEKKSADEIESAWPTAGNIDVKGLRCAYPSKPDAFVLKGIDFSVKSGSKLAVVGRTGAGKSTLLQCFFRLLDVSPESIWVDNVDITSLPLKTLREGLAVIPQAPTLFNGTLRYNLDPFSQFSDEELVGALHRVQLLRNLIRDTLTSIELTHYEAVCADATKKDESGDAVLDLPVDSILAEPEARTTLLALNIGEQGGALSVGQKQLLCAARALLKRPKVLLMDEATANVDDETDKALQFMIRVACRDTTVLTIAHRLQTVMDYDAVLVLDGGLVAEFGSPAALMADINSMFNGMLSAAQAA